MKEEEDENAKNAVLVVDKLDDSILEVKDIKLDIDKQGPVDDFDKSFNDAHTMADLKPTARSQRYKAGKEYGR
jgi:hypothetical protein